MVERGGTDHYRALGVAPTATAAEIRAAYLALARRHHPDRHVGAPATVRAGHDRAMRDANAAWAVLGDAAARGRYDDARRAMADGATPDAREARWAADEAAKASWRPFDDGPDPVDPRLLADEPPPTPPSRLTPFGVTWRLTGALGVLSLLAGAFTRIAALAGAGIVLVVLGGVLFLALPLRALGESVRNDRR